MAAMRIEEAVKTSEDVYLQKQCRLFRSLPVRFKDGTGRLQNWLRGGLRARITDLFHAFP
jgi:hypothetical protein